MKGEGPIYTVRSSPNFEGFINTNFDWIVNRSAKFCVQDKINQWKSNEWQNYMSRPNLFDYFIYLFPNLRLIFAW